MFDHCYHTEEDLAVDVMGRVDAKARHAFPRGHNVSLEEREQLGVVHQGGTNMKSTRSSASHSI